MSEPIKRHRLTLPGVPDIVVATFERRDDETDKLTIGFLVATETIISGAARAKFDIIQLEAQNAAGDLRDYLRKHLLEWLQ